MIEQNASPEVETFINGINSANIIEKDFLLQKEALAEAQGTSATGINQLTGGSGILGWLSGIFNKLSTSVAVTGTFFQAIQPVSGSVTANAGTNLNTSTLALESGGNLAAILVNTSKNQYDTNGNQQVNLNTAMSSTFDSIDVNKMSSGGVVSAHSAITATTTSPEIDCRGFNSIRLEVETTNVSSTDKTWTPTITGSCVSGGTFGQVFQNISGTQTALTLPVIAFGAGNLKQIYVIQGGIPSFLKITETLAGTNGTSAVTVKAVPFNV